MEEDDIHRTKISSKNQHVLLLLKIRNRILQIFVKLIDCTETLVGSATPTLGFDTPQAQIQQGLFSLVK